MQTKQLLNGLQVGFIFKPKVWQHAWCDIKEHVDTFVLG
jgi:hypothetical protein